MHVFRLFLTTYCAYVVYINVYFTTVIYDSINTSNTGPLVKNVFSLVNKYLIIIVVNIFVCKFGILYRIIHCLNLKYIYFFHTCFIGHCGHIFLL